MSKIYDLMKNRRSAKRYDTSFKIKEDQLKELLEVVRYSPSSYGMEAYKVYCIVNEKIKEELFHAWHNQPATKEASALFIWTVFKEDYMRKIHMPKQISEIIDPTSDKAEPYIRNGIEHFLKSQNVSMQQWLERQVYISLGAVVIAVEDMSLDCCPVEGFSRLETDRILEKYMIINSEIETSTVCLFLGKIDKNKKNHYSYKRYKKSSEEAYEIIE
ncbi:nitroreductase family protein [Spiroplasma tabanidicola]|uniref:Nitroreductase n=1 Tax=Spiroplasma tabanidicola TaxID=324079 RepID=A0A6I6C460_9MOLU|nr:nitroreductase family protein [Spiroplasma tabanidicola]QGS51607.1 nitroreductase [Spiroplasma tabanidicola]